MARFLSVGFFLSVGVAIFLSLIHLPLSFLSFYFTRYPGDPLHLPTLFVRVCIGCIIITIILVALCSMSEPCISIWLAC